MYITEEEDVGVLDQFLIYHQINWQKYKLAEQALGKQWQGKHSAEQIISEPSPKLS